MPSNFTKQVQFLTNKYFNGGSGDSVVGGTLSGVPANVGASQYSQTQPGDRIVLGTADALALSDTVNTGTLYEGIYQYVRTPSSPTATPTINRLAFWDSSTSQNQVTPDESGAQGANLIAGVFINTLTKGNSWWIQIAGRATLLFRTVLTGTAADGVAVYAAGAGAGTDVGTGDVLADATPTTFAETGLMDQRFLGTAIGIPVAGAASVVLLQQRLTRM